MKYKKYILLSFILLEVCKAYCQKYTISGYINDCKSGEKLIGVYIKEEKGGKGTSTNSFGFYSLTLQSNDSTKLNISCLGYKTIDVWVHPGTDQKYDFTLCEANYTIKQVEITANRFGDINQSNIVSIPMKEIKKLPRIFGESDVLRAYMLMPGIQGGKEGTSELYIRGGSPDQNLIILDDIPLYYINHLGGFVSIFNNSALKNVELIKAGFPARYGGRLSGVTDIRMKDGDMNKFGGEFSIGIISSKIMMEGPLKKNKSSFLISLRRSIFDVFLRPLSLLSSNGESQAGYTFYDFNAKIQYKATDKDRLFFSVYAGRDRFFMKSKQQDSENRYKGKDNISWGNIMSALRWNHQFSDRIFMNITNAFTYFAYRTNFKYNSESLTNGSGFEYQNGYKSVVLDLISKADFDFFASENHRIKFGAGAIYHNYKPGVVSFKKQYEQQSPIDSTFGSKTLNSFEFDSYIEDEIKIGKHFSTNLGIHHSAFIIENTWFHSFQPRLMALLQIKKTLSIKASFSQMTQNIHLLTNSNSSQPTDLWVPATPILKPENSSLYSIGFNGLISENRIEFGIDAFYKSMNHLIDYKEGASFFSNSKDWQNKVETDGKGEVLGLEFLLQKHSGKITGWIAYTLSKNERTFKNLNYGKPFPFKYDRRHDISIVFIYYITKKITLSANWTFNTGYHLTLAEGKYDLMVPPDQSPTLIIPRNSIIPPNLINSYAYIYLGKNNYQTNNYHRLDLSCSFVKKLKKGIRTWDISIYNVYNRLNPYYIYYKIEKKQLKLYQYSLFPFMPSISYSYKF